MATEMRVEAVVTKPPRIKPQAEGAAAAPPTRGASYNANETSNNDSTVANGDLQAGGSSSSEPKEDIVEDPPIVKTDRFGFTGGKQFSEDE